MKEYSLHFWFTQQQPHSQGLSAFLPWAPGEQGFKHWDITLNNRTAKTSKEHTYILYQ